MTEPEAPVFSRDPNGLITLRITHDEWDLLLLLLGVATGTGTVDVRRCLGLVNRLNSGNPDFTPYEIHAEIVP